ncbi:MAG: acyl-CoA/acyl-ACP dehydrogenase [Nocardia sp.]|nr:acyl-CoA/acyl-ACP dehydrogenase [Nocardia sp.]
MSISIRESAVNEFAELHDDLRAVARQVLAATEPGAPQDWTAVVAPGWTGLEIDAEFDGAGATFAEVAVVLREMGRALTRSPYASVSAAVGVLELTAPNPERNNLLQDVAAGSAVPVPVVGGEVPGHAVVSDARSPGALVAFELSGHQGQEILSGTAEFVADAHAATTLLIPARDDDGSVVLVALTPQTPGLTVTERESLDATRGFGAVRAENVAVDPSLVWRWADPAADPLADLWNRLSITTAIDSLGVAEAALEATVAHVGTREQFNRPVGSFQAVKHACADMAVAIRVAGKVVDQAVRDHVERAPDAWISAARAKAYTTSAAVAVTGKAIQLHGGMGYTWESGIHRHLKRATLNRTLFGSPARHRAELSRRYRSADFAP